MESHGSTKLVEPAAHRPKIANVLRLFGIKVVQHHLSPIARRDVKADLRSARDKPRIEVNEWGLVFRQVSNTRWIGPSGAVDQPEIYLEAVSADAWVGS